VTGAVLKLAEKPLDFAQLYRESVERIWRVISRLGVRPADVEDAVQDVYVIAHKRLDTLRPEVAPVTWLTGIAVKVAHDYRRTVQRKPTGPLEPASGVADVAVGPDELALRRDALGFALRLLDRLEPSQRDVFVLVEFEQLSVPEVAEVTSTPLNTVYSRLRLARAHFNELVAAQEIR
jgi:RNA polymerase sigma-70 factor, ECF subfamily